MATEAHEHVELFFRAQGLCRQKLLGRCEFLRNFFSERFRSPSTEAMAVAIVMTGVWLVLTFRWNAHFRIGREQQSITCRAVERLERSSARFTPPR